MLKKTRTITVMSRVSPIDVSTNVTSAGSVPPPIAPPLRQTSSGGSLSTLPRSQSNITLQKNKPGVPSSKPGVPQSKPGLPQIKSGNDRSNTKVSWRDDAQAELTKKQTILFIVGLGFVMVILGSGLTYYAAESGLQDFFIIGPGSLIIGSIFIILGMVFSIRRCLSISKKDDDTDVMAPIQAGTETIPLQEMYDIPQWPSGEEFRVLKASELYGPDDASRARRRSTNASDAVFQTVNIETRDANGVFTPTMVTLFEDDLVGIKPPAVALPQDLREVLSEKRPAEEVVNAENTTIDSF